MANCGNTGAFNLVRNDGVFNPSNSRQVCEYVLLNTTEYNAIVTGSTLTSSVTPPLDIYGLIFCIGLTALFGLGFISGQQR